jgi:Leucine-rich repeat (LRR) protein
VLNLSNNKLCADEGNDTREFRDCLAAVAHSLEELLIMENQIEDPEMLDFLMEPISQMSNLKHLNLSRNMLTGLSIVGLMQQIAIN